MLYISLAFGGGIQSLSAASLEELVFGSLLLGPFTESSAYH